MGCSRRRIDSSYRSAFSALITRPGDYPSVALRRAKRAQLSIRLIGEEAVDAQG
jgi:hypothetical protein